MKLFIKTACSFLCLTLAGCGAVVPQPMGIPSPGAGNPTSVPGISGGDDLGQPTPPASTNDGVDVGSADKPPTGSRPPAMAPRMPSIMKVRNPERKPEPEDDEDEYEDTYADDPTVA